MRGGGAAAAHLLPGGPKAADGSTTLRRLARAGRSAGGSNPRSSSARCACRYSSVWSASQVAGYRNSAGTGRGQASCSGPPWQGASPLLRAGGQATLTIGVLVVHAALEPLHWDQHIQAQLRRQLPIVQAEQARGDAAQVASQGCAGG